jgi:hypothetical protein
MTAVDEVEVLLADKRWVGGYEVCDLEECDGQRAFRVRRQSDGDVLAESLPATRIRPAHSAPRLPADEVEA